MFSKPAKSSSTPTSSTPKTAPAKATSSAAAPARRVSKGVPSILSDDLIVKGNIESHGDIQIEGTLEGDIRGSSVTIGESGAVKGNINADTVHIMGKVNGRIEATTIDIQSTAHVTAEMVQKNLTIASGAYVDGQCIHAGAKAAAPQKAPLQDA